MQVDPSPMNVGDAGTVSRESGALPTRAAREAMVGNPPQTLPPELRGDVPHSQQGKPRTAPDCKNPTAAAAAATATTTTPATATMHNNNNNACSSEATHSNHHHHHLHHLQHHHHHHCSPDSPLPPSPSSHQTSHSNSSAPLSGHSTAMNSTLHDRAEGHKAKADGGGGGAGVVGGGGVGVYPAHQWTGGKKAGGAVEPGPMNVNHGGVGLNKKGVAPPSPSVISLPPGLQCSTLFLSSPGFSTPLCKITLPPSSGQLPPLRKVTAGQFQKASADGGATQNLQNVQSSGTVGPVVHTAYPYHFQAGRGPAPDKRPLAPPPPQPKPRCNTAGGKNSKILGVEPKGPCLAPVVTPPSLSVAIQPLSQPHPQPPACAPPTRFTMSPTAAICCSPALANVTTQSKLLNLMEKGPTYHHHHRVGEKNPLPFLKMKPPSGTEEPPQQQQKQKQAAGCTAEERDVPLDLSSKSKRPKGSSGDVQHSPVPASEHRPVDGNSHNNNKKNVPNALERAQAAAFGSAPYSILPDTQRNGSNPKASSSKQLNHQPHEPATAASWSKHSPQAGINNIPGTYVGVASPILASTLRSKDGKGAAFVEDLQSFAKQETISIVDQGEQLSSLGKESSQFVAPKSAQMHCKSAPKHPNSSSSAGPQNSFPSKDAVPSGLTPPTNSLLHRKSGSGKATPIQYPPANVKPLWEKPVVLPPMTSVQRKSAQVTPKNKASTSCDGMLFYSAPKMADEEKWMGKNNNKSPLSNLESIVKQKALETTALTGEPYTGLPSAGFRRTDISSSLVTAGQNSQLQHQQQQQLASAAAVGGPPFRAAERQDSKLERCAFSGEPMQTSKRPEKLAAAATQQRETKSEESNKANAEREKEVPDKFPPSISTLACGGIPASKEESVEKSVAEQPAPVAKKEEEGPSTQTKPTSQTPTKAVGVTPAVLQGQSAAETKAGSAETNGTKEASSSSPFDERSSEAKQPRKAGGLKKAAKADKAAPDRPKKSPAKRPLDKDVSNAKQGNLLKKRKTLPAAAQSPTPVAEQENQEKSLAPASLPTEEGVKGRKGRPTKPPASTPDTPRSGEEDPPATSLQRSGGPEKQQVSRAGSPPSRQGKDTPSSPETPISRPRRGRRRSDERLLNDWSFGTPSPPPLSPPPPPPPPRPSRDTPATTPTLSPQASSVTPPVPVRRPRGRPRLNPLPEDGKSGKAHARPTPAREASETPAMKKRRRCRNRKYQNGEYITDKHKAVDVEERHTSTRQSARMASDVRTGVYPRLSATLNRRSPSPDLTPRRSLFTRSGSMRRQDCPTPTEPSDKPAGKRKFKSKHLITDAEDQKELKTKRGSLGKADEEASPPKKAGGPLASPKRPSSPVSVRRGSTGRGGGGGGGAPESPPGRPIPPEVRRLIVNKNAGETLLQRAARLGYKDVVLYCLEKDAQEVNRRDNAGYTALHEACARGWTQIVQLLLEHGADVNCSAQDGTRPLHDAVAADNLPAAWILLSHGADPTLTTYSGQTVVKLAHSPSMKSFLKEFFTDLEGRSEQDVDLPWELYSSAVFETDDDPCWDFLLSGPDDMERGEERGEFGQERDSDADCLLFEFSSEPLLPCYHVQVALTQGICNWFLLPDVLKRLKVSARIFRARYPHLEVASIPKAELKKQLSVSQTNNSTSTAEAHADEEEEDEEEQEEEQDEEEEDGDESGAMVDLVRCVPELQSLLGSSLQLLRADDDEDDEEEEEEEEEGGEVEEGKREREMEEDRGRVEKEERERRKRRNDSSRLCSR